MNLLKRIDAVWLAAIPRIKPIFEMIKTAYLLTLMFFLFIGLPEMLADPTYQLRASQLNDWQGRLTFGGGILIGIFVLSLLPFCLIFLSTGIVLVISHDERRSHAAQKESPQDA